MGFKLFKGKVRRSLPVTEKNVFFTSEHNNLGRFITCKALTFLLDNIYIRFGTKLFKKLSIFRWVLLLKLSFLFSSEGDFMASLSDNKEALIMLATYTYLYVLLDIDNPYFEGMVGRNVPPELQ